MSDEEPETQSELSAATVSALPGERLADLLAETWENRGWQTDVVEDDDGFLVTGDQQGQRGLILVLPGDGGVPGKRLQQFATLTQQKSVDVPVVATQGGFTDDAERIADANGVHLLNPQAILETVEAEGLEDTLSMYATSGGAGSGAGIGAALAGLPVPTPSLPSGLSLAIPGGSGLKAVAMVVLIAASLLAGFAGGAFLTPGPGGSLGPFGGGGDLAVASLSTAQDGEAGLTVRWNAKLVERVVVNGSTYEPQSGQRFLVVQFAVTNTGEERVPVRGSGFLVNVNGTRYAPQPLDGARTFPVAAPTPGNTTTGWVVYAIPAHADDAVIVPSPDIPGGPVTFIRDPTLTVNATV